GYLILDSDLHMMEPDDLWARYLEGPHRASLPRFFGGQQQKLSESSEDKGHADTIMGMEVAGLAIPAHGKAAAATASSRELRRRRAKKRAGASGSWAPSPSSAPRTRSTASICTTRRASRCGARWRSSACQSDFTRPATPRSRTMRDGASSGTPTSTRSRMPFAI